MKKFLLIVFAFLALQLGALADDFQDVKDFFQGYVDAANSYSPSVVNYYLPNAKIIRVVRKPDGTKVSVDFPMSEYAKQMKIGAAGGKLVGYKNKYTNRNVSKVGEAYRLTATRTPGADTVGLPCSFVIVKSGNSYKFKEESMDTNVQKFLRK